MSTQIHDALNNAFGLKDKEMNGLGAAFRKSFEYESCLPCDCMDFLDECVGREAIIAAGKQAAVSWCMGMMAQHTGDYDYRDECEDAVNDYFE